MHTAPAPLSSANGLQSFGPRLRPSVYERPVVRVRFRNPDGEHHQATFHSSWHDVPGKSDLLCGVPSEEARQLSDALRLSTTAFYNALDCEVLSVELVLASVIDFEI